MKERSSCVIFFMSLNWLTVLTHVLVKVLAAVLARAPAEILTAASAETLIDVFSSTFAAAHHGTHNGQVDGRRINQ